MFEPDLQHTLQLHPMPEQLYLPSRIHPTLARLFAVGLMLLSFWLMVSSALEKSATVDEAAHVHRGLAYLREGATQFRLGHPVTGHAIASLPALIERNVIFPTDSQAWAEGQWGVSANLFMWETGNPGMRLLFLARLVGMYFAIGAGALLFRWGGEVGGLWVGAAAAGLWLFDPNMIAHARLVTNDVTVAFCFVMALYGVWRLHQQEWKWSAAGGLAIAGLGLGLGLSLKFTAVVLIPIIAVLGLAAAVRLRQFRPIWIGLAVGLIAFGTIWVLNGFAIRPFPGGVFWEDFFWQLQYVGGEHGVFLNGEISTSGWWNYFLFAFAVKTPLIVWLGLILVFRSVAWMLRGDDLHPLYFWAVPIVIFFAFTQSTAINIGYRYLLAIVPFFALTIAYAIGRVSALGRWVGIGLALAMAVLSLVIWPNYLSFFNLAAGGPSNGIALLSDSNLDWGQDLVALSRWQAETGHDLNLSYFGTAPPSVYGLDVEMLPTWAPATEQTRPDRQTFVPAAPAPGWYAISATNLQGVVLGDRPDTYAYFRALEPNLILGHSLYLYEIEPTGSPTALAISGLTPADVPPEIYGVMETNAVEIRWFDAASSGIYAADETWIAVDRPELLPPEAQVIVEWEGGILAQVERLPGSLTVSENGIKSFNVVDLLSLELNPAEGVWQVSTVWVVHQETEASLKLFIHGLDAEGNILTQVDRLDVDSRSWQSEDRFWQDLTLPNSAEGEIVALRIGLYDAETGERPAEPLEFPISSLTIAP